MEIEKKYCVKDIILSHLELFYKMALLGVKNLNTAIDYLSIYQEYQKYSWIEKISEREKVVALQCKVNISCVRRAKSLMEQSIELKSS